MPFWDPTAQDKRRHFVSAAVDEVEEFVMEEPEAVADDAEEAVSDCDPEGAESDADEGGDHPCGDVPFEVEDNCARGSDDPGPPNGEAADDRQSAELVRKWPGHGKITFYKKKGFFEAVCSNRLHVGSCRRKRMQTASKTFAAQGRPLGLMASFLMEGPICTDKIEHDVFVPSKVQRLAARLFCRQEFPLFAELERLERPKRDDEVDDEPDNCP